MRIVLISDTHNQLSKVKVPDGDLLIHAGDSTGLGTTREMIDFSKQLRALPHPIKIFVPGNHDWLFERNLSHANEILGKDVHVLVDQEIVVEGIRIFGSPWTPRFYNWAFNLDRGEPLRNKWERIPEGVDVLVTHGPPYGILDRTKSGEHVGCEELRRELHRIMPKLHVFGHIHQSYGAHREAETSYINACICDENYRPLHAPLVVQFDPETRSFLPEA